MMNGEWYAGGSGRRGRANPPTSQTRQDGLNNLFGGGWRAVGNRVQAGIAAGLGLAEELESAPTVVVPPAPLAPRGGGRAERRAAPRASRGARARAGISSAWGTRRWAAHSTRASPAASPVARRHRLRTAPWMHRWRMTFRATRTSPTRRLSPRGSKETLGCPPRREHWTAMRCRGASLPTCGWPCGMCSANWSEAELPGRHSGPGRLLRGWRLLRLRSQHLLRRREHGRCGHVCARPRC